MGASATRTTLVALPQEICWYPARLEEPEFLPELSRTGLPARKASAVDELGQVF